MKKVSNKKQNYRHQTMKLMMKKYFSIILLSLVSLTVVAQSQQVRGVVRDASGEILIGVSVRDVSSVSLGTITDIEGKFQISTDPSKAKLHFSYVGYSEQTVRLDGKTELTIVLQEDTKQLDEIVVVGYGTQKKVNLSGSVSAIKMSDVVESRPITNVSHGLAGMASGVSVNMGSNRPGSDNATIRIRGIGTVHNSSPLVLIDGVEGEISSVAPQDIEDMSILKDASSSAIYGSRAANGVILITTKKGKSGALKVDYNGYVSWQTVGKKYKLVTDYADYMELLNEGGVGKFSPGKIQEWRDDAGANPLKYPNSNVMDALFSTGTATNHTLSVSGGSDRIRFFSSFGFSNTPGIMENSGYKRYSARSNVEADAASWLKLGVNFNGYYSDQDIGTDEISETFNSAFATSPGMVFRAPDGRYGDRNNMEDDGNIGGNNPYWRMNRMQGSIIQRNMKTKLFGTLTPLKGLSITGSFNYEFTDNAKTSKPKFNDRWNFYDESIAKEDAGATSITNRVEKTERYLMDVVALYTNKVSKLDYSVMVGGSQEQYKFDWFRAHRLDLLDLSIGAIDGAIGESSTSGNIVDWGMHSFFTRVNLGWDDKYLFEFNIRGDASSRFNKDNRWGYFPSASVAWRMDQEDFMKPFSDTWLSNLKLRASYGTLGNNTMGSNRDKDGNYKYRATYGQGNYALNNNLQMGVKQTSLSYPYITWETAQMSNIAVDFGVLNNKLSGTVDLFYKKTVDMLMPVPTPLAAGSVGAPQRNLGELVNKGLEVSLAWQDKIGDFSYYVNGNVTFLKNELTKWNGNVPSIGGSTVKLEGHMIDEIYVLQVDRIVQTQADLDHVQSLIDNAPIGADGKKVNPFGIYKRPELGDFLYKDTDGNGILDENDRVYMNNNTNPKFMFGFNMGAAYKGFDFSVLLQGATGMKNVWTENSFRPVARLGYQISKKIADGRWHKDIEEGTAKYPRLLPESDTRNQLASDFWVQNRSYFKIRNIQLGYSLPQSLLSHVGVGKVRIYGSLENFFTFTSYDGLDPEIAKMDYPPMKQALIGINVSF